MTKTAMCPIDMSVNSAFRPQPLRQPSQPPPPPRRNHELRTLHLSLIRAQTLQLLDSPLWDTSCRSLTRLAAADQSPLHSIVTMFVAEDLGRGRALRVLLPRLPTKRVA